MFPGFDRSMDGLRQTPVINSTENMSNMLSFTHVFDLETSLFLWYLLWLCLCTPKFYPKYSKLFFLSTPEGLKKCIFYVGDHDYIHIYVCTHTYALNLVPFFWLSWTFLNLSLPSQCMPGVRTRVVACGATQCRRNMGVDVDCQWLPCNRWEVVAGIPMFPCRGCLKYPSYAYRGTQPATQEACTQGPQAAFRQRNV
jgi:hypothetical protein